MPISIPNLCFPVGSFGLVYLRVFPGCRMSSAGKRATVSPYVVGGGGFAIGLFGSLGVGALLQSGKDAFALTVFGFVTCLILVMGIATTNLTVTETSPGKHFPTGAVAAGVLALLSFLVGVVGAVIFFHDYLSPPKLPATAFYSGIAKMAGNRAIAPELLINGSSEFLTPDAESPKDVVVPRDAKIEVRLLGAEEYLNTLNSENSKLSQTNDALSKKISAKDSDLKKTNNQLNAVLLPSQPAQRQSGPAHP
jgi:hypothetical protein